MAVIFGRRGASLSMSPRDLACHNLHTIVGIQNPGLGKYLFVDLVADFAKQSSKGNLSAWRGDYVWSTIGYEDVNVASLKRCLAK